MRFLIGTLILAVTGCGGGWPGPEIPAPVAAAPADTVGQLVAGTGHDIPVRIRFRWSYRDEFGDASGRGAAVLIPPDSLRFDFAGPLGSGRSAAAVVGETALWVDPEDAVEKLVPNYPILWAMLGRARGPSAGAHLTMGSDGTLLGWRYVQGSDTTEYILTRGLAAALSLDVRGGGERIGRVHTVIDAAGFPVTARLEVPSRPARLELRFYGLDSTYVPEANIWERPVAEP